MNVQATATLTTTLQRSGQARSSIPTTYPGRVPRVARLLAFADEIDRRICAGELDDLAHAARAFGLTRARVTQLTNLLLLAPAIQAEILAMAPVAVGRDRITERTLRPIVAEPVWERQQELWDALCPRRDGR